MRTTIAHAQKIRAEFVVVVMSGLQRNYSRVFSVMQEISGREGLVVDCNFRSLARGRDLSRPSSDT